MNRLRELRKEKKLTLIELSEQIHINKTSIARYETGEVEMKTDILQIFSNFFQVSSDYLLGLSNERYKEKTPSAKDQLGGVQLAFYNQAGEITEDQAKEVLQFIEFIKNRDKK